MDNITEAAKGKEHRPGTGQDMDLASTTCKGVAAVTGAKTGIHKLNKKGEVWRAQSRFSRFKLLIAMFLSAQH